MGTGLRLISVALLTPVTITSLASMADASPPKPKDEIPVSQVVSISANGLDAHLPPPEIPLDGNSSHSSQAL